MMIKHYCTLLVLAFYVVDVNAFAAELTVKIPTAKTRLRENGTSITFKINGGWHPTDDRTQPQSTGTGIILFGHEATAYEMSYSYTEQPSYRKPSQMEYNSKDYDRSGNLLYWRPIYVGAYFGKYGGSKVTTHELFKVDPKGSATLSGRHTVTEQYAPNETDWFTTATQLAMGMGTADIAVKSNLFSVSGLHKSQNPHGTWVLDLETSSGLVRKATFQLAKSGLDTTVVETSGVLSNGSQKIARNGWVRHSVRDPGDQYNFTGITELKDASAINDIKAFVIKLSHENNN